MEAGELVILRLVCMGIYPHPSGSTRMYSGATPHKALACKASYARATNVRGCSSCPLRPSAVLRRPVPPQTYSTNAHLCLLCRLHEVQARCQTCQERGRVTLMIASPRTVSHCTRTIVQSSLISTDQHNSNCAESGEHEVPRITPHSRESTFYSGYPRKDSSVRLPAHRITVQSLDRVRPQAS